MITKLFPIYLNKLLYVNKKLIRIRLNQKVNKYYVSDDMEEIN